MIVEVEVPGEVGVLGEVKVPEVPGEVEVLAEVEVPRGGGSKTKIPLLIQPLNMALLIVSLHY